MFVFEGAVEDHLRSRGVDLDRTRVVWDEATGNSYFFMYNLSGRLVGYQKYNPNYPKVHKNRPGERYFTDMFQESGKQVAVWGLETYRFDLPYVFVVEGIFDAVPLHNLGEPALANLGSSLSREEVKWYRSLPQRKIVVPDNDKAGEELLSIADLVMKVPTGFKDLGEMSPDKVADLVRKFKTDNGL